MMNEKNSTVAHLIPKRVSTYVGPLTDTKRWDSFQAREGDIIICTPPKCGTTWTQAICANLIFKTADFPEKLSDLSPWFDNKLRALDVCIDALESQTHRRFIKTHTPLDGIPYFSRCQYLIVYRNPKDVYFSLRNHLLNMWNPPDIPQLAKDPRKGFQAWLEAPFETGLGEQRSLSALIQHFLSYWEYKHLKNFHFFHYADMKHNISGNVGRIATILNMNNISDKTLEKIGQSVSFSEMRKKASLYRSASSNSLFKSATSFFNSGKNQQWQDVLTTDDLEHYNWRMRELLSPNQIKWLENGDQ
ncbi:MAG: sulfotransferase domain-containing protein [Microcystaceae cyanobacterium]